MPRKAKPKQQAVVYIRVEDGVKAAMSEVCDSCDMSEAQFVRKAISDLLRKLGAEVRP